MGFVSPFGRAFQPAFATVGAGEILGAGNYVARESILEWFQKPAAIYYNGRTYISWINHDGMVQIRYYDYTAGTWSGTVDVDNLAAIDAVEGPDDHNGPQMYITTGGKIQLYYCIHNLNNHMYLIESTNAEDITAWGAATNISDATVTQYNYPQVKRIASGNLVLFYRRGAYSTGTWWKKVSADNGASWGAAAQLVGASADGVYAIFVNNGDEIHCTWSRSRGAPNPVRYDIFYMYSSNGGANWKKRDGTGIVLPADETECDLVYDSLTGGTPAWVWDIRLDADNNPKIVFAHQDDPAHEFRYAWYAAGVWNTAQITTSQQMYDPTGVELYSGGINIDPNDVNVVYLSKMRTRLEIEKWSTGDGGATWALASDITHDSQHDNFRPQCIENRVGAQRTIWCQGKFTGYDDGRWTGYEDVDVYGELAQAGIPVAGTNGLLTANMAHWAGNERVGAGLTGVLVDSGPSRLNLANGNTVTSAAGLAYTNSRQYTAVNSEYHYRPGDDAELSAGDTDFTLHACVRFDSLGANRVIAVKAAAAGTYEYWLAYSLALNRIYFCVSNDGTATVVRAADTLGIPATNTWYHIFGWHDSVANTINIQVNNGVVDSTAHATGVFNGAAAFKVGVNAGQYMNGRICQVAFWKSAGGGGGVLTAAQRTALYNSGNGLKYSQWTT